MENDITTTKEMNESRVFTFGYSHHHPVTGQNLGKCYVKVDGDADLARARMFASVFGRRWAFDYPNAEAAGKDKFNLIEVELPDRVAVEQLTYGDAVRRAYNVGNITRETYAAMMEHIAHIDVE